MVRAAAIDILLEHLPRGHIRTSEKKDGAPEALGGESDPYVWENYPNALLAIALNDTARIVRFHDRSLRRAELTSSSKNSSMSAFGTIGGAILLATVDGQRCKEVAAARDGLNESRPGDFEIG
jgi:hypothetical protein